MVIKNKWKFATIWLAVLIAFILIADAVDSNKDYYNFGDDFKIKKSLVNSFAEKNNNKPFVICNIESNKCITFYPNTNSG